MIGAGKLSPEVVSAMRERAVLMFNARRKHAEIAAAPGVRRGAVGVWSSHYRRHGRADFVKDARGETNGRGPILSPANEREMMRRLRASDPGQLKLPVPLWTRKAVCTLAERLCGVILSVRTAGNYLQKWGFTVQKPVKRAYEQKPEAVGEWLDKEYSAIEAKAAGNAVILWADETHPSNQAAVTRGYSPKGVTPEVLVTAKRASFSVISAVSSQGEMRLMAFKGVLKGPLAVRFLERLVRSSTGRKVILIWDNLSVHNGREVKRWLCEKDRELEIEVRYLPSYSPQLNPDERLNRDLKGELSSKPVANSHAKVAKGIRTAFASIRRQPERIKAYFTSRETAYAA